MQATRARPRPGRRILGRLTALIRIQGRPLGVIANNPSHLAGTIDSDGADKAARLPQLCDALDLPPSPSSTPPA